jgi:hypothetical protein
MRHGNPLRNLLLVMSLAASAAWPQPLPEAVPGTYFDGRLKLQAPAGWTPLVGPDALLFRSDEPGAGPVEVLSWAVPNGGDPSARAAAAAHESLLFERAPYRRLWSGPIQAGSGHQGLLVTGRMRGQGDRTHRTTFGAFAAAGRYWIIGIFGEDEGSISAVPDVLMQFIAGAELPEAVAPPSSPVLVLQPPAPASTPQPVAVPGRAEPGPAPAPHVSAPTPTAPLLSSMPPTGPPTPVTAATPSVADPAPPTPVPAPMPATQPPTPVAGPAQPAATPAPSAPVMATVPATQTPTPVAAPTPPVTAPAPGAPALSPVATPRPPTPAATPQPTVIAPTAPAPVLGSAPTPRPAPPVAYQSPLGFSLRRPQDWSVQVVEGRIEVTSPTDAGSPLPAAAVIIWPVARLQIGQDPAELGRMLLARSPLVGEQATQLAARHQNNLAVLSGHVGVGGAERRVVACCHVQRDQGFLTAVLARPEEFEQLLPALLPVLDSFAGGPWWVDLGAGIARTVMWHEPARDRLRLPFPQDWQVRGQVRFMDGRPELALAFDSADGRLRGLWRQPLTPLFRDLTPVLRNLGWQEGDRYPANGVETPLRVMTRLTPQDFLTRYWLREGPARLEDATVDKLMALAAVAGLAGGAGAQGLVAELHGLRDGQPRQRICLIATGDAPVIMGPSTWQAAVLEAEAPAGELSAAVAVLRGAVEGAIISEAATEAERAGLHAAILAARTAMAALPASSHSPGQAPFAGVLTGRREPGIGRLWLLAPEALAPWQQAAALLRDHRPAGEALPELAAE